MIAQAGFVRYIHEPFNVSNYSCHCGVRIDCKYLYLTPGNINKYYEHLNHVIYPAFNRIGFKNFWTTLYRSKRIRSSTNYLQSYLPFRPLVKDPIALFSAESIANLFGMEVIVLIRHPAAVVSSYKALNWTHPFSHFLKQPELMEEHLAPFRHEIEDFAKSNYDIVDQAAMLWKLIHYRIVKYQEAQPDWFVIRYKDLASKPIAGYKKIFRHVGLHFSDRTHARIDAHQLQGPVSNNDDPYAIRQDPQFVMSKWRRNLTADEITRIRKGVEGVFQNFYSDDEW